jgi:hypothetical protein
MPAAQDPLNDVLEGGYVTSGEWHGPAWAITYGENATIDPESFVDHPAGEPLCISGYIEPTEDFSNGAILGFNVNQSPEVDSTPLTVVPTGNGLYVNLTNHGDPGANPRPGRRGRGSSLVHGALRAAHRHPLERLQHALLGQQRRVR